MVLGYINNEERRFAQYVGNRIHIIRKLSKPTDWSFIDTSANPADCATRPQTPHELVRTSWLKGPAFLYAKEEPIDLVYEPLPPEELPEAKTIVQVLATNAQQTNTDSPISALIPRFSRWRRVVNATSKILEAVKAFLMRFNTHSFSP